MVCLRRWACFSCADLKTGSSGHVPFSSFSQSLAESLSEHLCPCPAPGLMQQAVQTSDPDETSPTAGSRGHGVGRKGGRG